MDHQSKIKFDAVQHYGSYHQTQIQTQTSRLTSDNDAIIISPNVRSSQRPIVRDRGEDRRDADGEEYNNNNHNDDGDDDHGRGRNSNVHWVVRLSPSDGTLFYFDLISGKSQWESPLVRDDTPLHRAVSYGYTTEERVQSLLRSGAKPNARNFCGMTPLHNAVLHAYIQGVESLLLAGANALLTNLWGQTPLHMALASAEALGISSHVKDVAVSIFGFLRSSSSSSSSLSSSSSSSSSLSSSLLRIKDSLGNTCIHLAASIGNLPCLEFLVGLLEVSIMSDGTYVTITICTMQ